MESKEGKLSNVSKYGGLMLNDDKTWLNASPDIKADITTRLDALRSKRGCIVRLNINDSNQWTAMEVLEEKKEDEKPQLSTANALSNEDTKLRSMALSYSKDLCIGNKIDVEKIIDTAEKFVRYIKGE